MRFFIFLIAKLRNAKSLVLQLVIRRNAENPHIWKTGNGKSLALLLEIWLLKWKELLQATGGRMWTGISWRCSCACFFYSCMYNLCNGWSFFYSVLNPPPKGVWSINQYAWCACPYSVFLRFGSRLWRLLCHLQSHITPFSVQVCRDAHVYPCRSIIPALKDWFPVAQFTN